MTTRKRNLVRTIMETALVLALAAGLQGCAIDDSGLGCDDPTCGAPPEQSSPQSETPVVGAIRVRRCMRKSPKIVGSFTMSRGTSAKRMISPSSIPKSCKSCKVCSTWRRARTMSIP